MSAPSQQVQDAVRRHLERAEYRFDVVCAELLGEPRPESPEERASRELREAWEFVGRSVGSVVRAYVDLWAAFVGAFADTMQAVEKTPSPVSPDSGNAASWPPRLANRATRRHCEHQFKGDPAYCVNCGIPEAAQ